MKTQLVLIAMLLLPAEARAEKQERIMLEATVNGVPLKLALDTGSQEAHLYQSTAERLGLRMSKVKTLFGRHDYFGTEKCKVEFWGTSFLARVVVLPVPPFLHPPEDGLMGWSEVSERILAFDAIEHRVERLREVPKEAVSWTRFPVNDDWRILVLKMPGSRGIIIVDTGSSSGIGIPVEAWREWRRTHPRQPVTLDSGYTPAAGLFAREQAWASDFRLGPLALTDVIVEEADPWSRELGGKELVATLGLAALKRVDFIVDGKHDVAYLRAKSTPPTAYEHNRLGAEFLPPDRKRDDLIARVVEGSPASASGIRNGDVLLKVGDADITNWRADSSLLEPISWRKPAGTRVGLTLRRSNDTFQTTVTLREILAPPSHSR